MFLIKVLGLTTTCSSLVLKTEILKRALICLFSLFLKTADPSPLLMLKEAPEGEEYKNLKEKKFVLKEGPRDKTVLICLEFNEFFNHLPLSVFCPFFYGQLKRLSRQQTTFFF